MIDESQDTNSALIDALFDVERRFAGKFALGLFGDMMQRIYSDGKHDLGTALMVAMMYGTGMAFLATLPAAVGSLFGYRSGNAAYLRRTENPRVD